MKKNISINISGIIFYIEEDGYDKLKDYLDSINRYFSKFDDSVEIVSDIESRIAEIFLARLKEGRQAINLEDVESLIATMGSISDFKAVEDPDDLFEEEKKQAESGERYKPRRLFRDTRRKALGGVAAGLGYYFNIDPLWFRVIFLVFFISFFFEFEVSIVIGLIYAAMWIVIPASNDLPVERKYKKMFRNPDDKVLGGVAGGIAAYFGIDVVIVRLLFVIFIFLAFSGAVAYIILWIILPEAKTITDRMEMQGEPVTLSNIEANIKKSLNVKEGEENTFLRILLFPFRLMANIINYISKHFGQFLKILVDALRIIAGALLTILGIVAMIAVIIAFGAVLGVFASGNIEIWDGLPIDVIRRTIPAVVYVALFLGLFIPFLFFAILGLMAITKKSMLMPVTGWTMFAIWAVSMIALAISVPAVAANFSRENFREEVETFDMGGSTVILMVRNSGNENVNDFTTLRLLGHDSEHFKLVKNFKARGKNSEEALENTKMTQYDVAMEDSALVFDPQIRFLDDAVFRMQKVEAALYVPYNRQFIVDRRMSRYLWNVFHKAGYTRNLDKNIWMFTEDGIKCVSCPEPEELKPERETGEVPENKPANWSKSLSFQDFNALDIGSTHRVEVTAGTQDYRVEVEGDSDDIYFLDIEKRGSSLRIASKKENLLGQSNVKIKIGMPEVRKLDLHGASRTRIANVNVDNLEIQIAGGAYADIEGKVKNLDVEMSGSAKLDIAGEVEKMKADLSGGAILNAFDCKAREADITANAAATAKLRVEESLSVNADGHSSVSYQGNPQLLANTRKAGVVKKIE